MYKKIVIIVILLAGLSFPVVRGDSGSYYTGEAINFNNKTVIGTVDSGYFELFEYSGSKIQKMAVLADDNGYFDKKFSDSLLSVEDDKLYVYLVDGKYLYKYKIESDLKSFTLEKRVKDNFWGWYLGVVKIPNGIATVGGEDIMLWNHDLVLVDKVELKNDHYNNIGFNPMGDIIYNVNNNEGKIELYSVIAKKMFSEIPIISKEDHDRRLYFNDVLEELYLMDDDALKVYDYNGDFLRSFDHVGEFGYDAAGLVSGNNIYASDGLGIVKINKNTMDASDWVYTTDLGVGNGWAMGLRVVPYDNTERVVVFNHSSILLLDENLKMLDFYKLEDKIGYELKVTESLSLSLSRNSAIPGDYVVVSGKGFGANEEITVSILKKDTIVTADNDGRFDALIDVPESKSRRTDIKATGKITELSYSTSFEIE